MPLRNEPNTDRSAIAMAKSHTQALRWVLHALRIRTGMLGLICVAALLTPPLASAAGPSPVLQVSQIAAPTKFAPGGTGQYLIDVTNIGSMPVIGPITVTDALPPGVTGVSGGDGYNWACPGAAGATTVTCTLNTSTVFPGGRVSAGAPAPLLRINVSVASSVAESGDNVVVASAAEASADATSTRSTDFDAAAPPFGVASFSGFAFDRDGTIAHQAGGHPDVTTSFDLTTRQASGQIRATGTAKDILVDLPEGLVGNPTVVPTCSLANVSDPELGATCAPASQVGIVSFEAVTAGLGISRGFNSYPVYNIEAPYGSPGRFAFRVDAVLVTLEPEVVAGGRYTLRVASRNVSQSLATAAVKLTLWGVPADPIHDAVRTDSANPFGGVPVPSSAPLRPFITTPTQCSGRPLATTIAVTSWENPDAVSTSSFDHDYLGDPITTTGCDVLGFEPAVSVTPAQTAADSPTGLNVEISAPQNLDNPDGLANAQLKDVKVTLPDGMSINPGAADGLQACTDGALGLGNDRPADCPSAAKIGSVTATSPLLEGQLSGGVFIRSQASSDPESGDMFRMALVLENKARGVLVKLPGRIRVNKDTGRIVTEFDDNPQLPVDHVSLSLKSGPRAPLATPATCGTKRVDTELTSWAGDDVKTSSTFDIPCTARLGEFSPALSAGTTNPVGGAFSAFGLSITKPDGNADLDGLTMSLPTGLLAKLKGNLNTQVGTVTAFAGPGSNPFALPGKVFLEGAYGDAPFSLRVEVPAKAGPFDLGTVTVRQKIYVDPVDAHVTVVSDPVPTIVSGVPVRLQRLDVNVDKAGFIINPTSCAAKEIKGDLHSVAGSTAALSVRFQVGECAALGLKPSLTLTLSGKGQTVDGKHPAVSALLTQKSGQANLKKVQVALPLSLALDPDNAASDGLCSFVEGSKPDPKCPASSVIGKATAVTPILDEPLSGPVYFTKNERKDPKSGRSIKTTPKLVIPLVGQNGVKLTLTGTSTVVDDQLVTTFDNIPDAPVTSFKLDITGGKKGILVISGDKADICKSTQIADQQIDGQNTKSADTDVYIQTPSCPTKIISKKITAKTVILKIGGLGAGKVTITGHGIKKTTKTITKSTVATITAKRTGRSKPGAFKVKFTKAKVKAPTA